MKTFVVVIFAKLTVVGYFLKNTTILVFVPNFDTKVTDYLCSG